MSKADLAMAVIVLSTSTTYEVLMYLFLPGYLDAKENVQKIQYCKPKFHATRERVRTRPRVCFRVSFHDYQHPG